MFKFWKELAELRSLIAEKFRGVFYDVAKCDITAEEEEAFQKELFCYACQDPFDIEGEEYAFAKRQAFHFFGSP